MIARQMKLIKVENGSFNVLKLYNGRLPNYFQWNNLTWPGDSVVIQLKLLSFSDTRSYQAMVSKDWDASIFSSTSLDQTQKTVK